MRNANHVYITFSSVTTPSYITEVPSYIFTGLTQIDKVVLTDNITVIGAHAFAGTYAADITWSQNLEVIGDSAFHNINNSSLTTITLPNSVKRIEGYAFQDCDYLESVYLGNNIEYLGTNVFGWCDVLESVFFDGTLDEWLAIERGGDIFYATSNTVKVYVRDGDNWLDVTTITSYEFAEGVTEIPAYAFKGFSSLSSITIPSSVTKIGEEAFCGCVNLVNVTIPDSVILIERNAFKNCSRLQTVTLGNGLTTLKETVFTGCPSLVNIYYNGTMDSWWNMNFGNNVSGGDPFGASFVDGRTLYTKNANGEYIIETAIVSPAGVTKVKPHLFSGFAQFTTLSVSDEVTEIGYCSFKNCKGLGFAVDFEFDLDVIYCLFVCVLECHSEFAVFAYFKT